MHPPVDQGELEENLERAAQVLAAAGRVAVLTGAGVSAESGLATFRGQGGLWEGEPVESVATPEAFQRDPARVWRFYHQRRAQRLTVQPNPGHHALVRMEQRFGSDQFTLITQNVDRLHQEAGSHHVLEVHGNLDEVRCTQCQQVKATGFQPLAELPRCERCGGLLRPAVVWFHEMLPEDVWRQAAEAVSQCECLLVVGTSAIVYPAAGLIDMALRLGAQVIEVNLLPAREGNQWILGLYGPSGVLLPLLEQRSAAIAAERKP
jgi:NAD-dependent deacetylase